VNDRRSRELERHLGDDPQAEAELLARGLRAGELDLELLRLAAYLGHAPAQAALGDRAPRAPLGLESFARGLEPWGPPAWTRAALGAARTALAFWEERHTDLAPREALAAAEAWITSPSDALADQAQALGQACYELLEARGAQAAPKGRARSPSEESALAFRETRACALTALCVATPGSQGARTAVLAVVAARERLALSEVGVGPGGQSLFRRAAEVDRLGHLPELNTETSGRLARQALTRPLLAFALGR
jgi:nucleotide-binding universal stress UspA family protein